MKAPEAELLALATDAERIGSLPDTINRMAQSAYAVRDLWSSDTWRVVDEIEEQIAAAQRLRKSGLWSMQEQMDQLVTTLSAFSGLAMESMTRGDGWLFLDIGRRLERGLQLVSLLRTAFAQAQSEAAETRLIESLLDSSDNLICYRQHYRANLELAPFLELLLLDPNNPRSLAYQIARLQEHVASCRARPATAASAPRNGCCWKPVAFCTLPTSKNCRPSPKTAAAKRWTANSARYTGCWPTCRKR